MRRAGNLAPSSGGRELGQNLIDALDIGEHRHGSKCCFVGFQARGLASVVGNANDIADIGGVANRTLDGKRRRDPGDDQACRADVVQRVLQGGAVENVVANVGDLKLIGHGRQLGQEPGPQLPSFQASCSSHWRNIGALAKTSLKSGLTASLR